MSPIYRRVLLKLSGEALMGDAQFGIDPKVMSYIVSEISQLIHLGVQLGIVIGGGNIFRGIGLYHQGVHRVSADYMGMLATVMNALAIQDALHHHHLKAHVMSAISIQNVCKDYHRQEAIDYLDKGEIVIFAAGTGNPFFTTDTAASLRAIEIEADLMIKATKVDGVYSSDPLIHPQAQRFSHLTYDEVIHRQLGVMDMTAIILCRDHAVPLRVIEMTRLGTLVRTITGEDEGTLIDNKG